MDLDIDEMDGKIAFFILRVVGVVLGVCILMSFGRGLFSWFENRAAFDSIWQALIGDEPYCRVVFSRSVRLGGGILWRISPNGMLPALNELFLALFSLTAAVFCCRGPLALMIACILIDSV